MNIYFEALMLMIMIIGSTTTILAITYQLYLWLLEPLVEKCITFFRKKEGIPK